MADLTADVFDAFGKAKGTVDLNPDIFGIEPNGPVMHQVVTAQLAAARSGSASTKTRAEVRGGGAKPWRQKGLGRARHGSIRSPQWAGGGVAHGPKPRDYSQRTPKKMRRLALRSALSTRAAADQIKVVETFDLWDTPKTKNAVALLEAMNVSGKVLLLAEDHERTAITSFRNLKHVIASNLGQANTYDVLWADTIVMSKGTLDLGQSVPRGTEEHAAQEKAKRDEDGLESIRNVAKTPTSETDDSGLESIRNVAKTPTSETDDSGLESIRNVASDPSEGKAAIRNVAVAKAKPLDDAPEDNPDAGGAGA